MWNRIRTAALLGLVVLAGGWGVWRLWPYFDDAVDATASEAVASEDVGPAVLTLPPTKVSAMKLQRGVAVRRPLQRAVSAPGRLQYDDTRHVEIKTATAGILVEVRVKPGDQVDAGAIVAVVSSPEVGTARADVLEREADLQVAIDLRDWKLATCDGLKRMSEAIRAGESVEQIRQDLQSAQLGTAREQILSALSKHTLAQRTSERLQSAVQSGAVPQLTYQEAIANRDTAAAALDSILEQSQFDSQQQCQQATNAAADAERRLQVSRQHLRTLLGFVGEMSGRQPDVAASENLSLVEVRAPFAGTIERKVYSASERVQQGDSLFVLADTSRLWLSADLREREWEAAELQPGDTLQASFPVLAGESFSAQVYFVGREVDPATNALPLVAVIDNRDGRLRPGMFAQILLPVGAAAETLAVPDSALCEHQGVRFVFCPEGEATFRRVDVETGVRQGDWTEIRDGLAEGTPIVTAGCFTLKSELLLEREE